MPQNIHKQQQASKLLIGQQFFSQSKHKLIRGLSLPAMIVMMRMRVSDFALSHIRKSRLTNFKGKWSNWLPFEKILFPHLFDTPMHIWDQSAQIARHRNPLKNGSISENVIKEDERVLFQPFH